LSAKSSPISLDNKSVLVTGGTGSIGSQVVRELLHEGANVIVFSRDQNKIHRMHQDVASARVHYVNGDIQDLEMLFRAMRLAEYVIHCAANKHLPICEKSPDMAYRVNVEGSRNVLVAAARFGVKGAILLSTDKAVNPASVMGCTKFLAERIFLEFNGIIPTSVVRLGNVFGSSGSVVPTFQDRIKNKLPLIVNDPEAVRYFITKREAASFIVDRLKNMKGGEIFVKKMKRTTISSLAEAVAPVGYPIQIKSPLAGEKKGEDLITISESRRMDDGGDHIIISGEERVVHSMNVDLGEFTSSELSTMLKGTHER